MDSATSTTPVSTDMVTTDDTASVTVAAPGSWQETLTKSATLFDRSAAGRKRASVLLWDGAKEAIGDWLDTSDTDVHAEVLYADVLDVLGKPRKGDSSKIKSVALAVKNNGLILSAFPNLSKAYGEAKRLTQTVQQQAAEDSAADTAVEAIQASAPKSSSTPEGSALIVLSKGVDEAARLLLDALNAGSTTQNTAAHRSLLRAISQEIAGRIPKPVAKPKAAKKAVVKKSAAKKATVQDGAAKAKPVKGAKPAPKAKAAPVAAKPKPVPAAPVEEPTVGDMFDALDEPQVEAVEAPAKAKPVRRGPVRRG